MRQVTAATGVALACLVLGVLALLAGRDSRLVHSTLEHLLTQATHRETTIKGDVRIRWFAGTPSVEIHALSMKNPAWAKRPVMFSADRLTIGVSLGRLLRGQLVLPQVSLTKPMLDLERTTTGYANWELGSIDGKPTSHDKPVRIPTVLSLTIDDGSLHVIDQERKLRFDGSLAAVEPANARGPASLNIHADGMLNGRAFALAVQGEPLHDLTPTTAYAFTATIAAADFQLEAKVSLDRPFDFSRFHAGIAAAGQDMADVFYLTGLALPNTPPYRMVGTVKLDGTTYSMDDLKGRVGSTDVSGDVRLETRSKIPKLSGHLASKALNIVDVAPTFGFRTATSNTLAAEPGTQGSPRPHDLLIPDAMLEVDRVRGMDADVHYSAASVVIPRIPLKHVSAHLVLDHGVITVNPLEFVLDRGQFAGVVTIDARGQVPESTLDMRITDVELSQFKWSGMTSSPLNGYLQGRMRLAGRGGSMHQFAASAQGAVSLIIPRGEIDAGIAELTGIDVTRGLGLLLGDKHRKTAIRCGVMDFQSEHGTLVAKTFFIDTTDVLISGRGALNLGDEKLDFQLKGDPKHIRFTRVRAPIAIEGTLAHPTVGVDVAKLAPQGAVAAALGIVFAPLAVIAFIDPGHGKDQQCDAALSQTAEQSVR